MRRLAPLSLALLCCGLAPAEEAPPAAAEQPPATHQEAARQLIILLSDTEECLASCVDKDSVQAALPRFRELAARAVALKAAQSRLPDPTTQDYMLDQAQIKAFSTFWEAVNKHIERLDKAKLITPELREILHLAPEGS
ncbi:MAG: hypothetical protein J1E42_04510 [Akkermansiaceae bacterium]|nr:hypothetical protein [Akkermansiaceae bacterium]